MRGVAWFLLIKVGLGTNLLENFVLFYFEDEGMMTSISSRFKVNANRTCCKTCNFSLQITLNCYFSGFDTVINPS